MSLGQGFDMTEEGEEEYDLRYSAMLILSAWKRDIEKWQVEVEHDEEAFDRIFEVLVYDSPEEVRAQVQQALGEDAEQKTRDRLEVEFLIQGEME